LVGQPINTPVNYHGKRSKKREKAYNVQHHQGELFDILQRLKVDRPWFWGFGFFSMRGFYV